MYTLPTDRAVTWQGYCGVEGGIPTYAVATTLPANSSVSTINNALASAANDRAVVLQAGSGTWDGQIIIPSRKVLRGTLDANGQPATFITQSHGWPWNIQLGMSGSDSNSLVVALSQNAAKGATTLYTATKPASLVAGAIFIIGQLVPAGTTLININGVEAGTNPVDPLRPLQHIIKILTVTGSGPYTVTFEPPLAMDVTTANQAQLRQNVAPASYNSWNGIENFNITGSGSPSGEIMGRTIDMQNCHNSWVKRVRYTNLNTNGVYMRVAYRCEVRDSWFDVLGTYDAGEGYCLNHYYFTTGCLSVNNIIRRYHNAWELQYGGAYNVAAYNYMVEGISGGGNQIVGIGCHGQHGYMNLAEGNYSREKSMMDFTHGSNSHLVMLRNRVTGNTSVPDNSAIRIQEWNRQCSYIGNVVGERNYHTSQDSGSTGNGAVWVLEESLANSGYLRHGNYSMYGATGALVYNGADDQTLPVSLLYDTKPSWFGDRPWPPVDPTNPTGVTPASIPAGYRYLNGVDPPAGGSPPTGTPVLSVR